jgi:hypothetical protein
MKSFYILSILILALTGGTFGFPQFELISTEATKTKTIDAASSFGNNEDQNVVHIDDDDKGKTATMVNMAIELLFLPASTCDSSFYFVVGTRPSFLGFLKVLFHHGSLLCSLFHDRRRSFYQVPS